jgi:glycosyltransferase involved in cell wall biosynthesis
MPVARKKRRPSYRPFDKQSGPQKPRAGGVWLSGPSHAHLPIVCIFGADDITLFSSVEAPEIEARELDCHCFRDDRGLEQILIQLRPHVIITFGVMQDFTQLMAAPFEVRRRWLHFDDASDLEKVGESAFLCYLVVCVDKREDQPFVSVFTPTYRTGDRFLRPLVSMKEQTYVNWEWVIWDDSDDDGRTAAMVKAHADLDHRIRLIRAERHSGVIGEVKYNACAMSRGELLVELDHDDALTPQALEKLVAASKEFPEAGFFYSDYAEVDDHLNPLRYPDGWGFGLGSYRTEMYRGRELLVANTPGISPKTIRHLLAAPNHLRAWRRDLYFQIGGHNREIHVADDFELMVRTFLETRMVQIPFLGYVQYSGAGTTQRVRNKDIQRHVRYLRWKYDRRIHERFEALGVDDYIWDPEGGFSDFGRPNPEPVAVASWTATA